MTKLALIPAYEPDEKLISLADRLSSCGYEIIVINDGSSSDFDKVFTCLPDKVKLVTHEVNKGKGAAIKTGLSFIMNTYTPPYTIVTADADGQHTAADIERVVNEAEKNPDAFILGSRHLGNDVPFRSRFGNRVTRFVFKLSTGNAIYDTQTGLRAFTDRLINELTSISGERYEYEMNVLMELSKNKRTMKEVPIETIYLDGNSSSHFDKIRDSYRIYKEIIKFSASSLISFCVDYLLYCCLNLVTDITSANIIARICSASLNYTINRRYVFKNKQSVFRSLPKYIVLAAFILIFNTLLLHLFVHIGINIFLAKLVAEIIMFIVSYTMQHFLVF